MPKDTADKAEPIAETSEIARSSIRPVKREDGAALHALLLSGLPEMMSDRQRWLRRWTWQYWDNPFRKDRPAGWVLAYGDRVLGHLGAVYLPVRMTGTQQTGVVGTDYIVSTQAVANGHPFGGLELADPFFEAARGLVPMATTANELTGAIFRRYGCRPVGWTKEFWRAGPTLAQQIRSFRGARGRVGRRLLSGWSGVLMRPLVTGLYAVSGRVPAVPVPLRRRVEVAEAEQAPELAKLAADCAASCGSCEAGFTVERSRKYLDWRYVQHPESDRIHIIRLCDRHGSALAAAVVFIDRRDLRTLALVEELIVPAGRLGWARTLLCAALRLAANLGADHLVAMTGRLELRGVFWELGFESRARSAPAAIIASAVPGPESEGDAPEAAHGAAALLQDDQVFFCHGEMF